jgi:hypothetical protein
MFVRTQDMLKGWWVIRAAEYTTCGDEGVGHQHMYWSKVDATQCFGLSEPEKNCSRSTSREHHCLVGEQWDALRERVGFIEAVNPKRTMALETGNWETYAVMSAIARILLEETMNFKVGLGTPEPRPQSRKAMNAHDCPALSIFWLKRAQVRMVARVGTWGAYERVARHEKYMALEAWESVQYENSVSYYLWDKVCSHPFVLIESANPKVRANRAPLDGSLGGFGTLSMGGASE